MWRTWEGTSRTFLSFLCALPYHLAPLQNCSKQLLLHPCASLLACQMDSAWRHCLDCVIWYCRTAFARSQRMRRIRTALGRRRWTRPTGCGASTWRGTTAPSQTCLGDSCRAQCTVTSARATSPPTSPSGTCPCPWPRRARAALEPG